MPPKQRDKSFAEGVVVIALLCDVSTSYVLSFVNAKPVKDKEAPPISEKSAALEKKLSANSHPSCFGELRAVR